MLAKPSPRRTLALRLGVVLGTLMCGATARGAPPPDTASPAPPVAPVDDQAPEGDFEDGEIEGPETAASELEGAEAPERDPEPAPPDPVGCTIENPADPLYRIIEVLDVLESAGFEVADCRQVETVLQGRRVEMRLDGSAQELLLYVLERLATDGYWIELIPTGGHQSLLVARPSLAGERGVRYVRIDKLSVDGEFLPGDDAERIETILGLADNNFYPADVSARLQSLGYRAEFFPVGAAEVIIQIAPGRSIRRVRVRGYRPLTQREVQRQLSIEARPGALARGRCVPPKRLRGKGPHPPICEPADVACREWERGEVERIERFLFDEGYLAGTTSLALACGRERDEADLVVQLDKGHPYKIARRGIEVVGAADSQDARWIRRQFLPKTLWLFRKRVTRDYMEEADTEVETTYAEPAGSARLLTGTTTRNPHPQVQIETSYEDLSREEVPSETDLPLQVTVQMGREVETSFARAGKTSERLSFGQDELEAQLQLFKRRERPSPAVARREAENLRAFYQQKGFLLAQVVGYHEDFGAVQKLRFEIDEGPRASIRDIELLRPQGVPPGVLDRVDKAWHDARHLRARSRVSEARLFEDLTEVLGAYNEAGYLCSRIQARVAFWEDGLEEPGAHAVLTPQLLLANRSDSPWIDQFDPAGLAAISTEKRVRLYVRLEVAPGPRVVTARREEIRYLAQPIPTSRRVDGIPTNESGAWGARRILHASPLRFRGGDRAGSVPINLDTARETKNFVVDRYRGSGFPVADAEVMWRYRASPGNIIEFEDARDISDPALGICAAAATQPVISLDAVVSVYEGKRGDFGEVLFRGNFKTRDYILRRELRFEPGDRYSRKDLQRSVQRMEATGVTRGVTVTPYPVSCDAEEPGDCRVHQVVTVEEAKDVAMDFSYGLGIATLNPTYVFIRPKFPNLWGTGWDFDIDGLYGFDWSAIGATFEICDDQPCYEQSARATLSHPHIFGTVLDFELAGQVQRRVTPARGEIFSAYGNPRLSYRIDDDWSVYFGYLIQQANISKDLVKPLGGAGGPWVNRSGAIVPDRTGLLQAGVRLSRADNPFNPNEGYLAGLDLMLASPLLGGQDWWFRVDLTWQQFVPIPRTRGRLSFRYSLRFGEAFPFSAYLAETNSVPEVWRYYGGGTADLGIRGILPETMLVDYEEIELPYGGTLRRPRAQGGHIRGIGTVAWQVVSVKDVLGGRLAHSLFYDFGVLFQRWSQLNVARDYRHSVGINAIKWDIDIVTLALGYAVLVPGNARPTDDRNGRVVFDVGITF